MISKHDIQKFVQRVHRRGRGIPDRRAIHPRREWLIGLAVFLVVTGVGAAVSMVTFEQYKTIDKRTYEAELALPTYNEARTKTVLEDFRARKQAYAELVGRIEVVELEAEISTSTASSTVPLVEDVVASTSASTFVESEVEQFSLE